jgi:hypothetical protein
LSHGKQAWGLYRKIEIFAGKALHAIPTAVRPGRASITEFLAGWRAVLVWDYGYIIETIDIIDSYDIYALNLNTCR